MFYVKNVPGFERALRVIAGVAMVAGGVWVFKGDALVGSLLIGSGLMATTTGFVGFCPMCALAGRRLKG